jgi:hypothetical protein
MIQKLRGLLRRWSSPPFTFAEVAHLVAACYSHRLVDISFGGETSRFAAGTPAAKIPTGSEGRTSRTTDIGESQR